MRYYTKLVALLVVATVVLLGGMAWLAVGLSSEPPPPRLALVEGVVRRVDLTTGTLRLSWGPFGLLVKTLDVEPTTQIRMVGRRATLADIRESARVRSTYAMENGRNRAAAIDMVTGATVPVAPAKVSARHAP